MYETPQQYLQALNETGLKIGDVVKLIRMPVEEDGTAPMFCDGSRKWFTYYSGLESSINSRYTISYIDYEGLISVQKFTSLDKPCGFRMPFFLFEEYDHLQPSLKQLSKSNFLQWDRKVEFQYDRS